ncbi:methyl-accepting chemotaxis protein [Alteromonas sp. ASW11-130]|uniref:methyl-accepting chemotaxis protein n=1 Tax=Alteromonas sp. ASW11-130 TaxID=3015775 RepID=UPI002242C228|nr:methyl-accepting chemotaxis protein [Alteromonas sp. ASW11-130]MCW8092988.1 methyl-accepting chemotaxis protein [Alteromonas sp. ASW11-130]
MTGTRWFNNISIRMKLIALAVITAIVILIPAISFYKVASETLDKIEHAIKGVPIAEDVTLLAKAVAEYRGLSARHLSGEGAALGPRQAKAREVSDKISQLKVALNSFSDIPKLHRRIDEIQRTWQNMRTKLSATQNSAETFDESSELISSIYRFNERLITDFELVYVPSELAYNLSLASFVDLPQLTDALGKVRGMGAQVLLKSSASNVDKNALGRLNSNVEFYLRAYSMRIIESREVSKAIAENSQLNNQVNNALTLVEREIITDNAPVNYPSDQFFSEFTGIIGEYYEVNQRNIALLSDELKELQSTYSMTLMWEFIVILVLSAITLTLLLAVATSVTKGVNYTVMVLERFAKGDYSTEINVTRGDEIGKIEQALKELTQQLRDFAQSAREAKTGKLALDTTPNGIMLTSSEGVVTYANSAVKALLKDNEADMHKVMTNFDGNHLEKQNITPILQKVVSDGTRLENLDREIDSQIAIGQSTFNLTLTPLHDPSSGERLIMVEWVDHTDLLVKTGMLDALDRSQAIIEFTPDGTIVEANENFINTMGYSINEIKGKHHSMFTNSKTKNSQTYSTFWEELARGELKIGEFERVAKGGKAVWLQASYNPILDPEGNVVKVVEFATDITPRARTISDIKAAMTSLSQGELTARLEDSADADFKELVESINYFISELNETIASIKHGCDSINDMSSEIAKGNSDLSTRTEQQAANLEETASSMEEMTSTVQLNAENAKQANNLALESATVAEEGGALISKVVDTMSAINESAKKIEDIISVIDGIAFQTNILALNAAVEAARAGEQGRGFAVVATEVRTLAQRSANAAKDIKELISESVDKIESGNTLVTQSGDTMGNIVVSIKRVNDIMSEIAAASAEQANGIDEINRAVTQMDEMTQQNAALVEESAAAAENLSSQASELLQRVSNFSVDESDGAVRSKATTLARPELGAPKKERVKINTPPPSTVEGLADDDDEWENF